MSSSAVQPQADEESTWRLSLYIAGMTPTARRALANLNKICEAYLPSHYTLRIIDLLDDPQQAEDNQILAVPTLVRELPVPLRKLIGDLSDTDRVLTGLNLGLNSVRFKTEE